MRPNPENDALLPEHIDECIDRILEYTGGDRAAFDASRMTQDAVIRNLQVLAESTQRLSPTLKAVEQGVPWRSIAAFRNVLTQRIPACEPRYRVASRRRGPAGIGRRHQEDAAPSPQAGWRSLNAADPVATVFHWTHRINEGANFHRTIQGTNLP